MILYGIYLLLNHLIFYYANLSDCFLYFLPFLPDESEILDSFVTVFVVFKEKNSYANTQIRATTNIINDEE